MPWEELGDVDGAIRIRAISGVRNEREAMKDAINAKVALGLKLVFLERQTILPQKTRGRRMQQLRRQHNQLRNLSENALVLAFARSPEKPDAISAPRAR